MCPTAHLPTKAVRRGRMGCARHAGRARQRMGCCAGVRHAERGPQHTEQVVQVCRLMGWGGSGYEPGARHAERGPQRAALVHHVLAQVVQVRHAKQQRRGQHRRRGAAPLRRARRLRCTQAAAPWWRRGAGVYLRKRRLVCTAPAGQPPGPFGRSRRERRQRPAHG